MRKEEIFLTAVLLFMALAFSYVYNVASDPGDISEVCFDDLCFFVEIADSPDERQKGLMFRKELADTTGMLFIFEEEGIYSFWMKNTFIPLDIIWIDNNNKIAHIHENALPCKSDPCETIQPSTTARYVLELNAHSVSTYDIQTGQEVRFK